MDNSIHTVLKLQSQASLNMYTYITSKNKSVYGILSYSVINAKIPRFICYTFWYKYKVDFGRYNYSLPIIVKRGLEGVLLSTNKMQITSWVPGSTLYLKKKRKKYLYEKWQLKRNVLNFFFFLVLIIKS